MTNGKWPFYVSYSWKTETQHPLVKKLQKDAEEFLRLKMVVDTAQCKPGDSIKAFLEEVGQAPRLILILSEPYFHSEYTLKEFAIALMHGGLNTRVRVVLVRDFRLDYFLQNPKTLQNKFDNLGIDLKIKEYQAGIELLRDSLVSIPNADENTDFSPVLQSILESYQQYPNPEVEDVEKLINLRSIELLISKGQIKELLEAKDLQPVTVALNTIAASAGMAGKLPDLVCPLDVGDAQQRACEELVYPALCDALEAARRNQNVTNGLLGHCLQLVGLIATTFVNDMWIQAHGASLSDYLSAPSITIGLDNGHLIELGVARAHRRPALIKKSGEANFQSGLGLLFHEPDAASEPLQFVFQKLMQQFLPDEDCNEMIDKHWEALDARIRLKRRRENIFVAFRFPRQWKNLRAELQRKLQCLPQFWLNGSDEKTCLLLLSESKVSAFIAESVSLIEEYRQYAK